MKYLTWIVLAIVLALGGCSTTDYAKYADVVQATEEAEAEAENTRIMSLTALAMVGNAEAKASAIMALALNGGNQKLKAESKAKLAPPKDEASENYRATLSAVGNFGNNWLATLFNLNNSTRGPADVATTQRTINLLVPQIK